MSTPLIIIGTDANENLITADAGGAFNTHADDWITLPKEYTLENLIKADYHLVINIPGKGVFTLKNFFYDYRSLI